MHNQVIQSILMKQKTLKFYTRKVLSLKMIDFPQSQNRIIVLFSYKMLLSKAQKPPLAYARMGKSKNKNNPKMEKQAENISEGLKTSSGIYQAIMGGLESDHNSYIRQLLAKNQQSKVGQNQKSALKKQEKTNLNAHILIQNTNSFLNGSKSMKNFASDKKISLAESKIIESEVRGTHLKKKSTIPIYVSCQNSPKSRSTDQNQSSNSTILKSISPFEIQTQPQISFLFEIDRYISLLGEQEKDQDFSQTKPQFFCRKDFQMRQTINFQPNSHKYAHKLQKVIRQLKTQNSFLVQETQKNELKSKRLIKLMYSMHEQIIHLASELERERKERKNVQIVLQQFEMSLKRIKPEKCRFSHKKGLSNFDAYIENRINLDDESFSSQKNKQISNYLRKQNPHSKDKTQINLIRQLEMIRRQKKSENLGHILGRDHDLKEQILQFDD